MSIGEREGCGREVVGDSGWEVVTMCWLEGGHRKEVDKVWEGGRAFEKDRVWEGEGMGGREGV